jgi:hypothetical protein
MANDAAHVGQYVLVNENERFKQFKSGPPKKGKLQKTDEKFDPVKDGKKNVTEEGLAFDTKTGTDFWSAQDDKGNISQFGYKAPSAACSDGAPGATDKTHQHETSFVFGNPGEGGKGWSKTAANDGYINANEIPYVVIPKNGTPTYGKNGEPDRNKYDQITTSGKSPNAFEQSGLKPGDLVAVTNPKTGQTVYGIATERGPGAEVGENSNKLLSMLGMNPKNGNGGFNQMTDKDYLEYKFFPGSGETDPSGTMIRETNADAIQKKGAAVAKARALGGFVINQGVNSIRIGSGLQPAAFADLSCTHLGGGSVKYGSDSVSFENKPASRIGDQCTLGMSIITGEPSVQIFGEPVTASPAAGAASTPKYPSETGFFPEMIPDWARAPLGLPANPSLDEIAKQNSQLQFWKAGRTAAPKSSTSPTYGTSLLQGAGDSLYGTGAAGPSGLSMP